MQAINKESNPSSPMYHGQDQSIKLRIEQIKQNLDNLQIDDNYYQNKQQNLHTLPSHFVSQQQDVFYSARSNHQQQQQQNPVGNPTNISININNIQFNSTPRQKLDHNFMSAGAGGGSTRNNQANKHLIIKPNFSPKNPKAIKHAGIPQVANMDSNNVIEVERKVANSISQRPQNNLQNRQVKIFWPAFGLYNKKLDGKLNKPGQQRKKSMNNKDKKIMNNDEEEKVPNEHPIKRHSIGLGFYQTNYFSQSNDQYKRKKSEEEEMIARQLGLENLEDKEEEKILSNEEQNLSTTKRKPTLMPYNLPGDDLDNVEKLERYEETKNAYGLNQFNNEFGNGYHNALELINMEEANYSPQIQQFKGVKNSHKFGSNQQLSLHSMSQQELIKEVENLRKELNRKDKKVSRVTSDLQKLKKDNQSLHLRLQFEHKNNQVLLKNLTRIRQNYFQPQTLNSGLVNGQQQQISQSTFNQQMQNIIRNGNISFMNRNLLLQSQVQGQSMQNLERRNRQQRVSAAGGQINGTLLGSQGSLPGNHNSNRLNNMIQDHSGNNIIPNTVTAVNVSVASEQSGVGQIEQPPAQVVHSFQPPTRASQGIQQHQQQQQQQQQQHHQQQNNGPNFYHRANSYQPHLYGRGAQRRQPRHHRGNPPRLLQNGIEEEASLYDTQYNEESILINKVNEMQIKTSRFDQPQMLLQNSGSNQNMLRNEDFIPNEEPLINVREFWASNLSHNYRMRWPYHHQSQGLDGPQIRMRHPGHQYQQYNYYDRYPMYHHQQQNQQQPQQDFQGGQQMALDIRGQGNLHNVFNNSRRAFGLGNNPGILGDRIRVQSHGPPLRNINGDSQSLIEEDVYDNNNNLLNINAPVVNAISRIAQHQHQPPYHSDDSIIDFEEEEKHHALPRNHQMFLNHNHQRGNNGPIGPGAGGPLGVGGLHPGFSFDDGGMDEYDVADERQHLFEIINPDNMTYEELLALQDRIGYVNKGLTREQINSLPKLRRKDVQKYIQRKQKKRDGKHEQGEDDKPSEQLSELEIKNPLEESKKNSKRRNMMSKRPNAQNPPNISNNDDELDEVVDGDEGIINRRLPLNSYSHQVQVNGINIIGQADEEEGWENCKEEDEERKDGELIGQSLKRQVLKDKDNLALLEQQQLNQNDLSHNDEQFHHSQVISVCSSTQQERCAICFDGMQKNAVVKVLPCSHYYHCECIDQWLTVEKRCPMCMMYLDNINLQ